MPAEYNVPIGKELQIAKQIDKLLDQYREIDYFEDSPTVFIGHVIDGVRCNGHEAASSLLNIKRKMKDYEHDLHNLIKAHNKALRLTKKIRNLMLWFKTCTTCKGKKGRWSKKCRRLNHNRGYWIDCERCNGRGIIEK